MTNIEFLVNELRKATETIEHLRAQNKELSRNNAELANKVRMFHHTCDVSLGDLDALAALKRKMEQD